MTLKIKPSVWDWILPVAILIVTIVLFVKYYTPS